MGKILGTVATKLLSEKVLIVIVLKLGDWLVKRSSNELDDKIWAEVSKALESNGYKYYKLLTSLVAWMLILMLGYTRYSIYTKLECELTEMVYKVSGMVKLCINWIFSNSNFQPGHGLFNFIWLPVWSIRSFSIGIKTGYFLMLNNVTTSLETTATASSNNFKIWWLYNWRTAESIRVIASNTNATPPVLTIKDAFNPVPDTTSKYVIFPWTTDNANWVGKDGSNDGTNHDKDFITNGFENYTAESDLKVIILQIIHIF